MGGSGDVRGKFEQTEEEARKEEAEAREEEEEEGEEEMVPTPQRVTDLELGMYALLGIFCLAIFIFLVNGVVFVLRYQRKEPPDGATDPASPQPHNWVWLGTDQEELSRQLDRQSPGPPKGEGGCPCDRGSPGYHTPRPRLSHPQHRALWESHTWPGFMPQWQLGLPSSPFLGHLPSRPATGCGPT